MQLEIPKEEMQAVIDAVGIFSGRDDLLVGKSTLTLRLQSEDQPSASGQSLDRQPGETQTQHAERLAVYVRQKKAAAAQEDTANQVASKVEERLGVPRTGGDAGDAAVRAMGWDRPDDAA